MLSRRKPLGIGSDLIEKWVKISYTKICDSSLHPVALRSCIPVTLHLCDLTPYTLHLTPYTLRFHFSTSPFWPFAVVKMQNGRSRRGRVACLLLLLLCFFIFFFITRGDTSRRAGPHPPLSPHDVANPGYGASRHRSAYAACRWVCRSPRR